MYERTIFSLEKLTPHQSRAFRKAQRRIKAMDGADGGRGVHIKASAGAGKTYIALHTIVSLLMQKDASNAPILFVAPSGSLAIVVFKWIYNRLCQRTDRRTAKRKLCHGQQQRLLALISPCQDSQVTSAITIEFAPCSEAPGSYRLLVMDEAHHLLIDEALNQCLKPVMASAVQLMLLSDISQARAETTDHRPRVPHNPVDLWRPRACVRRLRERILPTRTDWRRSRSPRWCDAPSASSPRRPCSSWVTPRIRQNQPPRHHRPAPADVPL